MLLARADLYALPGFHDPFSAISHLAGAVIFLVLGINLLLRYRKDATRLGYLAVFVFACVFLMSMSALYHMMEMGGDARVVMERLDHCAIFVLIAGTFTPAHGLLFRGTTRWAFLLLIWSAAITGLTLKTIYFSSLPEWLGLSFYLSLGWLGGVSAFLLWRRFGFRFVAPLVWGGLAYTIGAVMEYLHWFALIPGVVEAHELFHLCVLVGLAFHWHFVTKVAAGRIPEPRAARPTSTAGASLDLDTSAAFCQKLPPSSR